MAWIYSQASEESASPSGPGCSPRHIVKVTDTLNPSYFLECLEANYSRLRYGMTSAASQAKCCLRSIWSMEASPARTSVLQDVERAWRDSAVDLSQKCSALSKSFDQLSCSLKMSLLSGQEDLDVWCQPWPASGMIVDGQLSQPKSLVPRTYVNDGSYLPTPTACDYGKNNGRNSPQARDRYSLTVMARRNLWPTPKKMDADRVSVWSHTRYNEATGRKSLKSEIGKVHLANGGQASGQLNPAWVEWLMGYRTGWTVLEDWATQWFRPKREKRS